MGKKILTLNIGASAIALAEYEVGGRSAKLLRYGTAALAAPLDAGNASTILAPALLQIVREKGIRPGRVAVSVSGQMAFPRVAAIPAAGGSERFESMVRIEIEQNIPFPIDEMVCDRQVLGDTETGDKSVLIVAAKTEQIEGITDALQSAGFSPEIVGVAPIATTNVLLANTDNDPSCKILLDIGAKTTSLVIVEGEKLFNRSIPVAGQAITKEIAQALGCTQDEAEQVKRENAYVSMGGVTEDEDETLDRISKVCRAVLTRIHAEISRSINYYRGQQQGSAPTRLYLTGGTSMLPQIADFFQDSLGIEVEYLNPFERIAVGPGVDASALETDGAVLAATAGLALQAGGQAALGINLMPPSILEAKAEVARIPFVAVGAAAFLAAFGIWYVAASSEASATEEKVPAVTQKANAAKAAKAAVEESTAEEKTAAEELAGLTALLPRRDASLRHLAMVREVIGENLWIAKWEDSEIEVEPPKDESEDNGYGYDDGEVVKTKVVVSKVTIRGWKDDVDAYVAAYNATLQKAEPAEEAEAEPAEEVEETPKARALKTAQEVVMARLKDSCVSVDDGQSKSYGVKGAKEKPLHQFEITIQFKEPVCK